MESKKPSETLAHADVISLKPALFVTAAARKQN
jgi:hypothetical protein